MKTQKELKNLLSKQVKEINLSQQVELADREITRSLQSLEAALTGFKMATTKLNDSNLQKLTTKTRTSINDIIDYLGNKKVI